MLPDVPVDSDCVPVACEPDTVAFWLSAFWESAAPLSVESELELSVVWTTDGMVTTFSPIPLPAVSTWMAPYEMATAAIPEISVTKMILASVLLRLSLELSAATAADELRE